MTFRIRKEPKKPERKTIEDRFWVDFDGRIPLDGISGALRDQVESQLDMEHHYYKKAGITLDSYDSFELEEESGWDSDEWYVIGTRQETDQELAERERQYKKSLKNYRKWYAENKDKIKAELKRRELAVKTKQQAEINRLESKLKKLKGA